MDRLARQLDEAAPGTLVESHGVWIRRLAVLARSLQACAGLALLLVAAVAAAVITVATRAGLAARRESIEIVHGLGATDGYIAARFAGRATLLAASGGFVGAALALPVLLTLANLAAPFAGTAPVVTSPDRHRRRVARCAVVHPARPARGGGGDRLSDRAGNGAALVAAAAMSSAERAGWSGAWGSPRSASRWRWAPASPGSCIAVETPAQAPPHADGIVAFTGGPERVETALRLLAEGRADRLLLSGIGGGAELAELAHRAGVDPLPLATRVTIDRSRHDHPRQCRATPRPGRAPNGIHSLLVVTASYHMPRAMAELERALPEVTLYPLPVVRAGAARTARRCRCGWSPRSTSSSWPRTAGLSAVLPMREAAPAHSGTAG